MSGFAGKYVAPEVLRRARAGDMVAHEAIFEVFSANPETLLENSASDAKHTEDTDRNDDIQQDVSSLHQLFLVGWIGSRKRPPLTRHHGWSTRCDDAA